MKNILNPSIRTMATKLCGGIVTPSQCTRNLVRMAWLLLIAGLLPMIVAAQTPTGYTATISPTTVTESVTPTEPHGHGQPYRRHIHHSAGLPNYASGRHRDLGRRLHAARHHLRHRPQECGKCHRDLPVHGDR